MDIFFKKINFENRGFTLIELLVVIAIIGILASVILASLNSARAKARDAQRTMSIKQVQNALELYFSNNGNYPSSVDAAFPGVLTAALTPTYIGQIPTDPNSNTPYRYYNNNVANASWYGIKINYETKTACYACGGDACDVNHGWWALNQCQ